jgi:hypothetical protein
MHNDTWLTIIGILNVIPAYLFMKGIFYRVVIKFAGEEDTYNNIKCKRFMYYLYDLGVAPDPELSKNEKMEWSKYWYIYCVAGIIISFVLLLFAEWVK